MKHIKRIVVITLITLISLSSAFIPFIGVNSGLFAYADTTRTLTNDEIDAAITAYIQSHGGGFSASDHRAVKWYTAQKLNTWLFGEGSQFTREQFLEHVEVGKNQSDGLFFKFDGIASGFLLNKMLGNDVPWNDTTAEYDENTGLFESGTDDNVYSGGLFTDDDGNSCLVYYISDFSTSNVGVEAQGTPYLGVTGKSLLSSATFNTSTDHQCYSNTVNIGNTSYNIHFYDRVHGSTYNSIYFERDGSSTRGTIYQYYINGNNSRLLNNGNLAIIFNTTNNVLSLGTFAYYYQNYNSTSVNKNVFRKYTINQTGNFEQNIDIDFYTNNNLNIVDYPDIDAEGNLYITPKVKINGEYSPYIVNEGDTINNVINNYYTDSGDKDKTIADPSTSPDSGGGGGGGNNPSGGTPPNWNNPWPNLSSDGEGGFNFNFTLPDLNIDWNINGLTEKFPFSIPFDFIAFCSVLNAEPQTPEWSGTLTLPMVNYPFTFSLQQFDNVAALLRNMEFIGFCIALILATRALIKG